MSLGLIARDKQIIPFIEGLDERVVKTLANERYTHRRSSLIQFVSGDKYHRLLSKSTQSCVYEGPDEKVYKYPCSVEMLLNEAYVHRKAQETLENADLQGSVPNLRKIDLGTIHLQMDAFTGRPLDSLVRGQKKQWSASSVIEILKQIVQIHKTLFYDARIIDRDIKPANFAIDETGKVTRFDFGLSAIEDTSYGYVPCEGKVCGTPGYLSSSMARGNFRPEYCMPFMIGIIGYELFLGRRFLHGNVSQKMLAASQNKFPRIPSHAPPYLSKILYEAIKYYPDISLDELSCSINKGSNGEEARNQLRTEAYEWIHS